MLKPDAIEAMIARVRQQLAALQEAAGADSPSLEAALGGLDTVLDELARATTSGGTLVATSARVRRAELAVIAGELVHDIGNPLAGIAMQAQLILRRIEVDAHKPVGDVLQPLQRIVEEVDRINLRVREFADFAYAQPLHLEPVVPEKFLRAAVARWHRLAARGIALTLTLPPDLPRLRIDIESFGLAFDHILRNAVEAIESGSGHVDVRVVRATADTLIIAVEDSGRGLPST
ncbi:MAG TPA: hypothetical protein VL403_18895, partial [Candidatus Kryptonia bacterium]|nr:hypothetical protein [Candidatus Kryptonia bacterium]